MEKYLIILIIIITTIVCYCTVCDNKETKENKKTKESFTNAEQNFDYTNAIETLGVVAKALQSPTGLIIPGNLNLKNKHILISDGDKLTLKNPNGEFANMGVHNLEAHGNFNLIPRGIIVAWTGQQAPAHWALCDGQNGTPDLRGRFILTAGQGALLTTRNMSTKGGAETVTLTEAQMPAHSHPFADNAPAGYGSWGDMGTKRPGILNWQHIPSNTQNKGGNQPHENMPPFYVLAYIMKL